MDPSQLIAAVLSEVQQIPVERLPEVYRLLQAFRLKTSATVNDPRSTMRFAGCWSDLPDATYDDLTTEIATRRQQAFSERRTHETSID